MDSRTIVVDHYVRRFTVEVRSMNYVNEETIKRILETKLEVTHVKQIESQCIPRGESQPPWGLSGP